jgi:hypothetical protein
MEPGGVEWIATGPDAAGLRLVVFVLLVGAGALTAWTVVDIIRRNRARAVKKARDALGVEDRPAWAQGDWACGRCRSVNRPSARRCARCRGERPVVELRFDPPAREPDVIPAEIRPGPGALVMLEHDAAAHARNLNGHWLLRVNGVIAGSAATRDGALQLLCALRDAPSVMADTKGEGYAGYPTDLLAAAFAGPQLPYAGPCPEQTRH